MILSKAGTKYLIQARVGTKKELSFCFDLREEQRRRIPGITQDELALDLIDIIDFIQARFNLK